MQSTRRRQISPTRDGPRKAKPVPAPSGVAGLDGLAEQSRHSPVVDQLRRFQHLASASQIVQRVPSFDDSWSRYRVNPLSWNTFGGSEVADEDRAKQKSIRDTWNQCSNMHEHLSRDGKSNRRHKKLLHSVSETLDQTDRPVSYTDADTVLAELKAAEKRLRGAIARQSADAVFDFRQLVVQLPRGASADYGKEFPALTTALAKSFKGMPDDMIQDRVDEMRKEVDILPDYVPEGAVNLGHRALGVFDRKIGMAGMSYLGPSKTADNHHVMTRGITEAVRVEGAYYVPIYVAIFSDALQQSPVKHKDVGQDDKGRIQVHTGGGDKDESTMWLSIGRPLRQVKWLEKYAADKKSSPLIRSFLLPVEVADKLAGNAITEHNAAGSGKDLNVDKHYERNQYGVVAPDMLEAIRQRALPGSLRTYAPEVPAKPPANWGDTRSVNELRARLGIGENIPNFDVFVNTKEGDFTKQADYPKQAETLAMIYAYHTGDAAFLPETKGWLQKLGVSAPSMPDAATRKDVVEKFYKKHEPKSKPGLDKFIQDYVKPWAEQAAIAIAIAEDYEDIADEKHRDQLPTKAPKFTYTAEPKGAAPLRGQRRSGAIKESERIQALLQKRRLVLDLAAPLSAIFGHLPSPHNLRAIFGQTKKTVSDLHDDYQFRVGDYVTVEKKLPAAITDLRLKRAQIDAAKAGVVGGPLAKVNEIIAQIDAIN